MTLHRCFNFDLPDDVESTCAGTLQGRIENCQETRTNEFRISNGRAPNTTESANIQRACGDWAREQRASNPNFGNRASSSALSVASPLSTAKHEILHLYGLGDEYEGDRRPFDPLGSHDSIMRSSANPAGRLYPYHLRQLVEPLSCPAARGMGLPIPAEAGG